PELSEHRAIEFTPAQLADAMNVCFEGYIMTFTLDAATFERRFRPEGLDTISSVILKSGDKFAAICLIARQGWTSRVAAMAIAPDFRRKGVGQLLMNKVIEEARKRGDRQMFLEVIEQNPPAIALYESVGMAKTRRLVGYRREPSQGLAESLVQIDPSTVIRAQAEECPSDLPWDFKPETLTLKMGFLKGFSLGDDAFALISDPPGQRVIIWSLFTRKGSRRSGFGGQMVEALAASYPDRALVTSVALPDDYCPEFLTALDFAEVSISQFEMAIEL
ncbi:MAG: GNAT family N-acetyltransferase, partial [Armatimonadota bacterium]